jgi:hypothetical protein
MTRKAGEEVIIVGMKGGEAYNGRKAIWLNYDRERNEHRIKVFVNAALDDEILLVKGENITSDKKFLKEHPEYDTPHKRKRLGTLEEVLKENGEKKKKEKGQKKLIENPFVKKDGKIVENPKAKRATVKKRGWTPGSYARARAKTPREGEGGRFPRRDEEEDEHEGEEEEEDSFHDERTVDRKVAVMRQKLLAMNMQLNARFSSDDLKDALLKTRANVDGAIDALLESKRRTDEEEDERERRMKRERTTTDAENEVIVLN